MDRITLDAPGPRPMHRTPEVRMADGTWRILGRAVQPDDVVRFAWRSTADVRVARLKAGPS